VVNQLLIDILGYGHVLAAMGWLGGGILTGFVIAPNLRKLSPAAGMEFNAKVLPKVITFVQASIGATLVFGLLLVYFINGGDLSWLRNTSQGYEISIGMAVALVTAILAWTVTLPAFRSISRIASSALQSGQQGPLPEMMTYAKRARLGATTGVVLLLFVLSMMVASGFS
jgi:Na+(H+)/acetate symporter ActP